jgi:hypothetical protein
MNIFDLANDILVKKRDWSELSEEDKKAFTPFMVIKFMGMNKDLCVIMNDLQIQDILVLSSKDCYNIIKDVTPKGKKYLSYIKGTTKQKNTELIAHIAKYFECSTREASEYLLFLSKEDLKDILSNYSLDDKEILKMIK